MKVENNIVGWFEIYVTDMDRAKKFYTNVFQREMMDLPDSGADMHMCMFFSPGNQASGASGALVKSQQMKPGVGGTLVYFTCNDCAQEGSRVVAQGGKLFKEKMSIGKYGYIAIAEDTEGNMIGLHSIN
ncbi:MAG: VOC family protein [Bacteriovorax sp.]|nr:VOC family protein [Bacteriovorax sp.]